MKMRVALIEPSQGLWEIGSYCRHSQFEPLGLEYIGAVAQKKGYAVKIIQQRGMSDEGLLDKVIEFNPDIVGFSVVTYNIDAAKSLTHKIKKLNPKIITVFGGYHPTAEPSVVKDESIDYVVVGEGEQTFLDLVHAIENGDSLSKVKGIAYFDGEVKITAPRERINNLDELPFPLRDKSILNDCKIEGFVYPSPSKQNAVAQELYSRGCLYNCTFCCSPSMWGKAVKYRTPTSVIAEMKQLQNQFGTNLFFFADLTFNLNKRKIIELCNEMLENDLNTYWYAMCRPDNVESKLISIMEKAGCSRIAYGIDSINDKTLQMIKPNQKINLETMKTVLEITNQSSISTRAFVIIGYPWETKQDLLEAKEFLKRLPIDDLRIGILTPLPGSAIYEEFKKEGLLLHEDFSKYTTEECVMKLKDMTPEELYEIREQIFKEFYQSKEYQQRMKEKIRKYPHLKQSYDEFFEFLNRKGVFK